MNKRRAAVHRNRWLLLVLALVAVLTLGAAGCGGDDDDAAGDDTGATDTGAASAEQVLRIAWGAEPASVDPGKATDTTSANVISALMDPLVKLNPDTGDPEASAADSWEVDGPTVTFHLNEDATWTNGDPVTAQDYVYSWKRTLSPELAADYAYQLYGVKGAAEYNGCEKNCDALADKVAVTAVDDYTLQVELTSEQPWFLGQVSHHSFLPVHQATVEEFGDNWTDPENIVTNGPFMLESWDHEASINMVKNPDYRDAENVSLERIDGPIIVDGITRVQAFEAGEVDALDGGGLPPEDIERLKAEPYYEQYPSLGTYYYGFNVENIGLAQRKAMSLAINRKIITDQIDRTGRAQATGMTPEGIKGFDVINPNSPWLPAEGDMEQATALMAEEPNPDTDVNLFHNDAPGHPEIAVAVQSMWDELGIDTTIKSQEWAQYLEFLGPPPNKAVDAYRLGWIYDFPDAINGLELFTCDSGNNNTNWCNEEFDALVEEAKATIDDEARYEIYRQLEGVMFDEDGEVPLTPIMWYTTPNLESDAVRDTFFISPLNYIDFTKIAVQGG
jgi:ABC-type oligopeptide transport system substrate-binding subunit